MLLRHPLTVALAALALTACGGGGGDSPPSSAPRTTAVKVAGDSLNDSGTFGLKFTVQGTYAIWTEHVAAAVSAPALCPAYTSALALKPVSAGCTSHGVGGGAINRPGTADDTTPLSIVQQLKDIRTQQARYNPEELLLVDGGGNDMADLTGAFLNAAGDSGASFVALAGELLSPSEVGSFGADLPAMGTAYATKLADLLADTITTEALDRDAQRVVVITAPDVTRTPKFLAVLALVNASGPSGPAQVTAIKATVSQWTTAFNNRIKARFAVHSRVVVVDFYAEFNKWLDTPTTYGLTNTTTPACPRVGTSGGLPTYNIASCTDTSLSAAPPPGETGPNWWKSYVFSDDFHGTPRTNELMGQLVVRALEAKGWK